MASPTGSAINCRPPIAWPPVIHHAFPAAVLHAVKVGGQNQARAMLTGALVGAQGLSGIPQRFSHDLEDVANLELLAELLALQAAGEPGVCSGEG